MWPIVLPWEFPDYGDSIEEVMASIKDGIQLAVESLVSEKLEVPTDEVQDQIITTAKSIFPWD